jgi:hypothetical protein
MTTLEIINIAKVSQYLAAVDVAKGVLYGKRVTPLTAKILYAERAALEWMYSLDPTNDSLIEVGDYVYSLCRGYNLQAQYIINSSSGGGGVVPIGIAQRFPIYITQDNFTTATFYPNTKIFGNTITIFLNQINRYLLPAEFSVSQTGVTILLEGFDATTFDYELVIEKVYT